MNNSCAAPEARFLKDYAIPDYLIDSVDLVFDLDDHQTRVAAKMVFRRQGEHQRPLRLQGEALTLVSVVLDDTPLTPAQFSSAEAGFLVIDQVPETFTLETQVIIDPANNKNLDGLYKTGGAFCTQCEAEGFRRITYFLDRPDVLTKYTTKVIADKQQYPLLLSNGNKIASGDLDNGRHWVLWQDPFNKPSYLFALLAGDFDCLADVFTTMSGREVKLEIYVDKGNLHKASHAMVSLKKAMKWDEDVYGLEYDLDIYMIVAVDFFNMGAMENKGLNVFNSKFVLASESTATDIDYHLIEAIIGHEYFHNWTGNRVTCRDWFQLSLKEGLTVFRDQQFSTDMGSDVVNRISAVKVIRTAQFAEDSGPMAHSIRPEMVIEMNNFYTVTVYNKGAEVIRMMHSLLGVEQFRKGIDLYFVRHDGCAVTCDDFVAAMQDASGVDLSQFKLWYSQSGTPLLTVATHYDAQHKRYTMDVEQTNYPTADQTEKQPLHIPFAIELLDEQGQPIPLQTDGSPCHSILDVRETQNRFIFDNVQQLPTPVLLENFSAPVKVKYEYDDESLLHIIKYASNGFSRWDAAQTLYINKIKLFNLDPSNFSVGDGFIEAFAHLLNDETNDPALLAELITLPTFANVAGNFAEVDVDCILLALNAMSQQLSAGLYSELLNCYQRQHNGDHNGDQSSEQLAISRRSLKNACLMLLAYQPDQAVNGLLASQFERSENMTDSLAVLTACCGASHGDFFGFMETFEQRWRHEPLVMDKWFSLHASWPTVDVFDTIERLYQHPVFDFENPNRLRAVVESFTARNPGQFHRASGEGYQLLTDVLIKLNSINPQIASRLLTPLMAFKRYDQQRQMLMRDQLQRLAKLDNLSADLYEKVSKSLS